MSTGAVTPNPIPPPPAGYGPVSVVPPPPPGYGPVSIAATSTPTSGSSPFTANPKNEGTYEMKGPNGPAQIPYSQVEPAQAQGYSFAAGTRGGFNASPEEERYNKDRQYDPTAPDAARPITRETVKGAIKDAAQIPNTVVGWLDRVSTGADKFLDKIDEKISGQPSAPAAPTHMQQSLESAEEKVAPGVTSPIQGQDQEDGAIMSQIGQWMAGEGLLKAGMSAAEKSTIIARMMTTLEKNPVLAKAVSATMKSESAAFLARHAAVAGGAGAQTLLHGGTPGQAAQAAAIAGAGGAAIEGVAAGGKALLAHAAAPSIAADAVTDAAKNAVSDRLEATNATRQPVTPSAADDFQFKIGGPPTRDTTEGSIAQEPQKRHIATRVVEGKGPSERQVYPPPGAEETSTGFVDVNNGDPNAPGYHKSPVYRLTEDSKPGSVTKADSAAGGGVLLTKDVGTASAHMRSLDQILADPDLAPEDRAGYQAQRDDIQQQIVDYYKHQKAAGAMPQTFQPVDVQASLNRSGSPREAAAELDRAGAEVYNHANNVSGGQWQALKNNIEDLGKKLNSEPDIPSNAANRASLRLQRGESEQAMYKILDDPRNGFDAADAEQAKRNFHTAFVLKDMDDAINPIYAIEQHQPLISGTYKGFNGNQLAARWRGFLDDRPEARQILGSDRVDTLSRLFDANKTMAGRKRFGGAVLALAGALAGAMHGPEAAGVGLLAGAGADRAIRETLNGLISTPKVAKSLLFAIDSGARPENYAPGLARQLADRAGKYVLRPVGRAAIPVAAGAVAKSDNEGDQQ